MTDVSDILTFLQLLITTLVLIANTSQSWLDKILKQEKTSEDDVKSRPLNGLPDLAIGWGCSIIFILTAGHSIAIAGTDPTVAYTPVLSLTIGALIVGVIVTYAWNANRLKRSMWLLSLASIIIMLIGPGGPIFQINSIQSANSISALEPALPYWIAMSALVAIFIAFYIADYPSSLNYKEDKKKLIFFFCGLLTIALCSGAVLIERVVEQTNTPSKLSEEAKELLIGINTSLRKNNDDDFRDFYRVASEIELTNAYRNGFFSTLQKLQQEIQDQKQRKTRNNSVFRFWELYPEPNDNIKQTKELFVNSYSLSSVDRREFLERRLEWHHAITSDGRRSILPVQGRNEVERQVNLANDIVRKYAKIDLSRSFGNTGVSNYNSIYNPYFSYPPETIQEDEERDYYERMKHVFPDLEDYSRKDRLVQQLVLPFNYELGLTFLLYQQYVIENDKDEAFGNIEIANQQFRLNINSLRTLYEIGRSENAEKSLTLLYKVRECENYDSLRVGLEHMAFSTRSDLAYEGLLNIYEYSSDENKELIEFFSDSNLSEKNSENDEVNSLLFGSSFDLLPDTSFLNYNAYSRSKYFTEKFLSCGITKKELQDFLKFSSATGPLSQLFASNVLDFIRKMGGNEKFLDGKVAYASKYLLTLYSPIEQFWSADHFFSDTTSSDQLLHELVKYNRLPSEDERRSLLNHLSVRLYSVGGDYSPTPLGYIISHMEVAGLWGGLVSLVISTVFVFPIFAFAIIVGLFAGRMLITRSAVLAQADDIPKSSSSINDSLPESPTHFVGRVSILNSLKSYAKRGWNTVALIGPRGVGKSEILKELIRQSSSSNNNQNTTKITNEHFDENKAIVKKIPESTSIGVWLQAPTKFDEIAIVAGAQRRIAEIIENRISKYLDAANIAERELRENAYLLAFRFFIGIVLVAYLLTNVALDNISRLDSSVIWMPVGLMAIVATGAWFFANIRLQRKDLGVWLRRNSKSNPHLELLYERSLLEILGFDPTTYRRKKWLQNIQFISFMVVSFTLINLLSDYFSSYSSLEAIFRGSSFSEYEMIGFDGRSPSGKFYINLLVLIGSAVLFVIAFLLHKDFGKRSNNEISWATIVDNYRAFIRFCLERLDSGAFGKHDEKWSLIIAIDELDRITDSGDLRAAIIRMRSLFEIRGAYYYLSLASDSFNEFMKNESRTKTEMDSAFDHIQIVKPLKVDDTKNIIESYLGKRDFGAYKEEVMNLVTLLSYGIPRDTIRRCDSILAIEQDNGSNLVTMSELMRSLGLYPIDYYTTDDKRIDPRIVLARANMLDFINSLCVIAVQNKTKMTDSEYSKLALDLIEVGYDYHEGSTSITLLQKRVIRLYDDLKKFVE